MHAVMSIQLAIFNTKQCACIDHTVPTLRAVCRSMQREHRAKVTRHDDSDGVLMNIWRCIYFNRCKASTNTTSLNQIEKCTLATLTRKEKGGGPTRKKKKKKETKTPKGTRQNEKIKGLVVEMVAMTLTLTLTLH